MKMISVLFSLLLSVFPLAAQGTLNFEFDLSGAKVVPPNNSSLFSRGGLLLNGNELQFTVGWYAPFSPNGGGIYGPAQPDQNANQIFDFFSSGTTFFVPPDKFGKVWEGYEGTVSISDLQKSQLFQGLWYVSLNSDAFPTGEVRGQIPAVPEPSTFGLLGFGLGVIGLGFWRKSS